MAGMAGEDNEGCRMLADMLMKLGLELKAGDRATEAASQFTKAIESDPSFAQPYFHMGVIHDERGAKQLAADFYKKALDRDNNYVDPLNNLALIRKAEGNLELAREMYVSGLKVYPNNQILRRNLCTVMVDMFERQKEGGEASPEQLLELLKNARSTFPFNADVHYQLAVCAQHKGKLEKAFYYLQMATHLDPKHWEAWYSLASLYKAANNIEGSGQALQKAIELRPGWSEARHTMGMLYAAMGKDQDAETMYSVAIQLDTKNALAMNDMGVLLRDQGRVTEAIEWYKRSAALNPQDNCPGHNLCLAANYDTRATLDEVQGVHLDWGKGKMEGIIPCQSWPHLDPEPERKITVGYVSPDFYYHSVSYFCHALFLNHDREKVKVVAFSNCPRGDHKTGKFKALVPDWYDIFGKTTEQVCELVKEAKVDILVDLTGHTAHNRLDVFARKPAPIQITWIGYPNSTGLPTIDYRLTDERADPSTHIKREHYSEELVRLDPCFLCYCPDSHEYYNNLPEEAVGFEREAVLSAIEESRTCPPPTRPPCLTSQSVTLGTFNSISKISEGCGEAWAEIMNKCPSTKLLLKSKPLNSQNVKEFVLGKITSHGVSESRISTLGVIPFHRGHMDAYNKLDIALDPWPYCGTATSCEALYMGVPMVTLTGQLHCNNVGASLLNAIGLNELIAESVEQYVQIVTDLVSQPSRIEAYKATIRDRMTKSKLCNGLAYARQVEGEFAKMRARYLAPAPPRAAGGGAGAGATAATGGSPPPAAGGPPDGGEDQQAGETAASEAE